MTTFLPQLAKTTSRIFADARTACARSHTFELALVGGRGETSLRNTHFGVASAPRLAAIMPSDSLIEPVLSALPVRCPMGHLRPDLSLDECCW